MSAPIKSNPLPRYRGFNLLDMYLYERGREDIQPGDATGPGGYGGGDGDFRESDFQMMADWGFDFARIPMDYRYWTHLLPEGTWEFRENVMRRLDRLIALGNTYNIHLSFSMHRAPGYCVNAPAEPTNLWHNRSTQQIFCEQWRRIAERFHDVPAKRLSFDLLNEPPAPTTEKPFGISLGSGVTRHDYASIMCRAAADIHAITSNRIIFVNGLNYGNEPVRDLACPCNIAQSCRAYMPFGITHYQAHWVNYSWKQEPQWPDADHFGHNYTRENLATHFEQWTDLTHRGIGVHCGEFGCFNKTPHPVTLAWMRDVLALLKTNNIGWALWNLRGDFGILDSARPDVAYENYNGHQLDREMLELLRSN